MSLLNNAPANNAVVAPLASPAPAPVQAALSNKRNLIIAAGCVALLLAYAGSFGGDSEGGMMQGNYPAAYAQGQGFARSPQGPMYNANPGMQPPAYGGDNGNNGDGYYGGNGAPGYNGSGYAGGGGYAPGTTMAPDRGDGANMDGYWARQRSQDQQAQAFGGYINDTTTVRDTETGEIHTNMSNTYANPAVESGAATVVPTSELPTSYDAGSATAAPVSAPAADPAPVSGE